MYCDTSDVTKLLGTPPGSAWTDAEIVQAIEDATDEVKSELLTGAISADTIATWGSTAEIPKPVTKMTACLSAAYVRKRKMSENMLSGDSEAADFYKEFKDKRDRITKNKAVLFDSDNNVTTTSLEKVRTSGDGKTPHCSMGNSGDGSIGNLDNF